MEKTMGKALSFTLNLTVRDLWAFSMYHSNRGVMGTFNVIFTAAALYLLIFRWETTTVSYRILMIVCALMFTVWQPMLLLWKAGRQAKTPTAREPMDLSFSGEGLTVEQNGQQAVFGWDQMGRMERIPGMIVLYMDRLHAYLIPNRVLGEQKEALCQLARTYLPRERRKRI